MRYSISAFVILIVVASASSAGAQDNAASSGPLGVGRAAGVGAARSATGQAVLIGLGAGLTGLAIAAIASNGKAGGTASTSTVATGTSP